MQSLHTLHSVKSSAFVCMALSRELLNGFGCDFHCYGLLFVREFILSIIGTDLSSDSSWENVVRQGALMEYVMPLSINAKS